MRLSQEVEATQTFSSGWMNKHNVEYAPKGILYRLEKDGNPAYPYAWTNLEAMILSEISQSRRDKYCVSLLVWGI